jgi:dipeptide/tripeptide permease
LVLGEQDLRGIGKKRARRVWRDHRVVVSAALALALVSFFFLLQVVPHEHANGQDDPACRICQIAHAPIAPAVCAMLLSLVLLYFGEIFVSVHVSFTELFFLQSPSRAPPALVA